MVNRKGSSEIFQVRLKQMTNKGETAVGICYTPTEQEDSENEKLLYQL